MMPIALVALGGFIGANARWFAGVWVARRQGAFLHHGTRFVNLTGSVAIGVVTTLIAERFSGNRDATLLFVTGFLGAYTTFSAFSFEVITLIQLGLPGVALRYFLSSTLIAIFGALLGIWLTLAVI